MAGFDPSLLRFSILRGSSAVLELPGVCLVLATLGCMPNERDMLNVVAVVFMPLCLGIVNLEPPLRC